MRSHIAIVTPGSSVQSVNTGGEWRRVWMCVVKKTVCYVCIYIRSVNCVRTVILYMQTGDKLQEKSRIKKHDEGRCFQN